MGHSSTPRYGICWVTIHVSGLAPSKGLQLSDSIAVAPSLETKTKSRRFCDELNAVEVFKQIFKAALGKLLPELSDCPWFVREREVVNLFAFRCLIPEFQNAGFGIDQIGIEFPLQKLPGSKHGRPGSAADLLVWSHEKATLWSGCKPLARIEWKNKSCRGTGLDAATHRQQEDVEFLRENRCFSTLNFAVLTTRHKGHLRLCCKEVTSEGDVISFFGAERQGTGDESEICEINYSDICQHPGSCADHSSTSSYPAV